MKTVKLKTKKKRQILWKRFFALVIIAIIIFIALYFTIGKHIGYKYYIINEKREKIYIGQTFNDKIDDTFVLDGIHILKDEYMIVDYSASCLVETTPIIVWDTKKFEDKETEVKQTLMDNCLTIVTYAIEIGVDDDKYIMLYEAGNQFMKTLSERRPDLDVKMLQGLYVNRDKVLTPVDIDQLLLKYGDKGK